MMALSALMAGANVGQRLGQSLTASMERGQCSFPINRG